MKDRIWNGAAFGLLLIAGLAFLNVVLMRQGEAPTPRMFEASGTFAESSAKASEASKPLLVVATAVWCGPCQVYKKNALADADVQAWVEANAEAVLLDVDAEPRAAQELGIQAIPTTLIIRDGVVVDRFTGVVSAGALLGKLKSAAG